MMKILHLNFLFYFLIILCHLAPSQNVLIDSLKSRLNQSTEEEKIKVLIGISYNFLRISADSSIKYSNLIINYSKLTNNQRGVARGMLMLGSGHNAKGEYSLAIKYQLSALNIFEELHDTAAVGITYNNLGTNYHNLGNYSEAINQYQSSIKIAEKLSNNNGLYIATNNIGTIYEDWGKFKYALEYYSDALKIAKEVNDQSYIGISLQNIGVAHHKLGNNKEAMEFLERSLQISQQIGDKKGIYNTYLHKGEVCEDMDNKEEAVKNFEHAMEIAIESDNNINIAEASLKLGTTYTNTGELIKAYSLLNNAHNIAQELDEPILIKETYKALADYFLQRNNFEKAYGNFINFTIIKDTLFNHDTRREISEMHTLYELDKKEKEIEIQNLKIDKQKSQFYYIFSGVLLLLILAILLFNWYKLKQKHVRSELEKKNIDIEQRLLRTQMNPHFIFNSLNSINSFITDNNSTSAQKFLSKFARLMRYILENSRQTYVSVEDELNTLKLNMELERLRLDNKFDFEIQVAEKINPEDTFIPPMLIQPFVENAIIHGISPKKGSCNIKIELRKNKNLIHCIIEDDGVGRGKTIEIKPAASKTKHRSMGMQVTAERLDILNEKSPGNVSFRIIDLKDESENPLGTRVELNIPFEEE